MEAVLLLALLTQYEPLGDTAYQPLGTLPVAQVEPAQPTERTKRVLFFTARWCGPCQRAKAEMVPWMTPSGWVCGELPTAHVQIIDGDQRPDLVRAYRVAQYPTFILIENGQEVRRVGYSGPTTVTRLWGLP